MLNTVPDTTNTNPIFSSYNVRSADFNENMDEFVKAPNELYIEEQKKKQAAKSNLNSDAIKNVPDMPEFLKEEYEEVNKMPEWLEKLNICSPDEIEEWKNKGGMGIAEAWRKNRGGASFLPYVNTTKDAADAITASVLLNRAKKGEELTYEQQEKLVDYLRDVKELQVRGFTFGGGTVNAILATIPYIEEFAIGLGTSEAGVGLASLSKTLGTIGAKKAARKAVEAVLKEAAIKSAAPAAVKKTVSLSAAKKIYKDTFAKTVGTKALVNVGVKEALKETGKALPHAFVSSAKFGLTKMPETFMGGIADRQLATGVYVTDMGDAVFTDSEHLALSIMKSLGDSTFEALTETAGWSFSPVANYFAKPIQKVLPKKFFTGFEKLVSSRYGMPAAKALRKYGYDGVLEEMGEEFLNRFLCQTFGINGLDEYNFDGFMNNVFYADNLSQWGQEALSFAAVGGAGHIAAGTQSKVADVWSEKQTEKNIQELTNRANRYIQSPEQFYLEQGLIKIKGSQSAAEQKLRDIWTSQNVDKGLQDDVLKNMSENEIRTELRTAIENQTQDAAPEIAAERIEKELTNKFIENKTFADEKDAKSVAALFSAPLQKLSEVTGLSLEEVMEEEMPEIQREAEAAAKENGRYIHTDGRIEEIFQEFNELPDDFSDEEYLTRLMEEVDILSKIRDGILPENEFEKARIFINSLDKDEYSELINELRELSFKQTGQYFQSVSSAGAESRDFSDAKKVLDDVRTFFNGRKISPLKKYYQGTNTNYTEQLEDVKANRNYKQFVNKVLTGALSQKEERKLFEIGKTPTKLVEAGITQNTLTIGASIIRKAQDNKNADHNLSQKTISSVLEAMRNPIAVIKAEQNKNEKAPNNRYSVILDLKDDAGKYVLVALDTDKRNGKIKINDIRSIHSRINYEPIIDKAYNDKRLLKVDADKIKGLLLSNSDIISEGVANLIDNIYQQNNNVKLYQSAYHGTPHKFDKFSLEHIGSGEGAQAHGWGLYFAESKEVSEEYRNNLSSIGNEENRNIWSYKGKNYELVFNEKQNKVEIKEQGNLKDYEKDLLLRFFDGTGKSEDVVFDYVWLEISDEIENLEIKKENLDLNEKKILENLYKEREILDSDDMPERIHKAIGQLFKVDIPESNVLLDEDKKFSEQPENVQNAIKELAEDYARLEFEIEQDRTGKDIYQTLAEDAGSYADASMELNDCGIKGITYDGKIDGRCYVVFDDNAVKVLEKYYQFAGESSETADKHTLKEAKKRLKDGEKAETVRKETGWFKGADGKFRYEISDADAIVDADSLKKARQDEINYVNSNITAYNLQMSDLVKLHDAKEIDDASFREQYDSLMNRKLDEVDALRFYENKGYSAFLPKILDHKKLYAAYPSLRSVRVEFKPLPQGVMGRFSNTSNEIILDTTLFADKKELKKTLMHEIQHFIQHKENFAVGGNAANIEIILADAKNAIENSKDSKEYDFLMKKYSIVNNVLLIRAIQDNPEKITKSYWWMQQGKGWYAPRKTRKAERRKYINECCQEFIDYSIQKHKENNTFEAYKNYSKNDTAELKKIARRLNYRASKVLDKIDFKTVDKIDAALKQLNNYEVNTFDLYKRLAGEVEARNTAKRANLTDEERKKYSPNDYTNVLYGVDVKPKNQIVVFDDGTEAFSESDMADDAAQGNLFYDNITPRKLRNMNIKGSFVPAENLIELFKNADESTIIHEFAHWWLSRLEKYAKNNEELALDLAEVRKFVKNNGEAFTREQHEKFAVGFEAYIRNGSARSNRLKRIFEDFKNALIQIYDSIKQLVYTEDGTQYSFSEADVENLNKLFERLLTTENERIRKTVFDRCDDINDRIKEIKANQETEMRELDELWRDNIAINNRKSDKKRKVQEYLEMADAASRKLPKEVKEMQKRYKDVTFAILEQATGYKRQFIANPRNWEKVQEKFEGTDNISASDGMLPEWREFYEDTGVSYDNQEVNADESLAQQAYDVMVDGTYTFGMNEDEISEFYGKFDYLYSKVKTLKGEEKQNAWEALVSLFDNMPSMPDEVVEDLAHKLSDSYEVYEEGQKEDFNRKHFPNIPVIQQLQMYVTLKLDKLKVYDPNVKYKVRISRSHSLYKAIKNATSVNATKRIVRMINDYVISDLENQAKTILHKEIQKQIRVNSKLVKVGTLSKGKFDWKTNTVFAELAEINKLKQKEALKEYGMMIELDKAAAGEERDENDENPISTPEFKTDFQSNLRRKFLEYRSSKIKDLNLLATRSLLEDIMTLKFEGRRAKDAEELEKQLQKDNMKTDLAQKVRALKGNKLAQEVAKFIMGENPLTSEKTLANWESSLNALFGREVAQRYSLLKLESDAEVYAYKHYADFCQKAMEIYGLDNPINAREKFMDKFNRFVDYGNIQPLVKLMQEYEEEIYNFRETTFSKETGQYIETGVQLSRAEIITLYAWSMNEELEQRIMTQYGFYQVQYMFDEVLSDEDKQLAWLLIDTCESMYDENNEVFIRTMGLSLPKVQNYFPSKTVRVGSEIDMLHENVVRSSNPSFIKQRKTCNRIKMKPEQPISILLPHINKTARYVVLSERMNYLNAIFKDATVRAAIKEVFDGVEMPYSLSGEKAKGKKNKQKRTVGDRIHDTLLNQLGSSTFENYVRGLNVGKSWADVLATNYITSRIGGNLKVLFGQLTSVINYAEKMPVGLWSKGFMEGLKTPKETLLFMLDNCDYLKARLAGNSMNEVMARITDESDRFRTLRNFCSTNTKYGDILAISFGGKPYIDYLIKQGMSKEQAFEKFVEDTLRAQQSGHNSATSVWQKKMSENFFTRMMFAFNNTSLQYERKFLDAVSARTKGEIGNKEFIKAVLLYKVFNPIIFTSFLGNLSLMQLIGSLMRGDDDDALERFGIDAASAMVFSNMGAYGFAGMGISTALRFLMTLIDKNEYKPFIKGVPIIEDVEEIGKNLILKNEITFADWVEAMSLIGDDATGVPVSRLTNTAGGIGDAAQGEYGVGVLRMLGYGNYRANVAATGEPPKKRK